jgi:hypothetical protein
MVVSCHQNDAGQNHILPIANKPFDHVAEMKHLGTVVTNKNCIPEKL